jgi:hypothetical protein
VTAHRSKPTITPAWIERFARYYRDNPAWGVFHVCLDDHNWDCPTGEPVGVPDCPADMRAFFDALSPSQRRRLGRRAEALREQTQDCTSRIA